MPAVDVQTPSIEVRDSDGDVRAERERLRRYQDTERELMTLLDSENTDEATRKRKLVYLFDRFRLEYTSLSVQLRESVRAQRKLMGKCMEMKAELVTCALKIRATEQAHLDEIKSLTFYRDECEHAWQQSNLSRERERDAVRMIDELRLEIEKLQLQVKALVTPVAATAARRRRQEDPTTELCSPPKHHKKPLTSPSKTQQTAPLMSFDEWKAATRVWTPSLVGSPRASVPTQASLVAVARNEELARCVSVPSLHPTPMERAATSIPKSRASPTRRGELEGSSRLPAASPSGRPRNLPVVTR